MHVAVVPTVTLIFIGIHLLLVRRDSPVKPISPKPAKAGAPAAGEKVGPR